MKKRKTSHIAKLTLAISAAVLGTYSIAATESTSTTDPAANTPAASASDAGNAVATATGASNVTLQQDGDGKFEYTEGSPFNTIPAYLDSEQTAAISYTSVRPRVLILVDDSGSMNFIGNNESYIPGECNVDSFRGDAIFDSASAVRASSPKCANSRIGILYNVLKELAGPGKEFNDNIKYNVMSIWGNGYEGGKVSSGYKHDNHDNKGIGSTTVYNNYVNGTKMVEAVGNLYAEGGTPTTAAFVSATDIAYKNIEYACQKSYIILLSDGQTNFDVVTLGGKMYGNGEGMTYSRPSAYQSNDGATYNRLQNSPLKHVYGNLPPNYFYAYFNGDQVGKGMGISFFTHKLYNKDTVDLIVDKDAHGNTKDKEGNPWTGNQNIQTYTIGFGREVENGFAWEYLKDGAKAGFANNADKLGIANEGAGAYLANDKQQLKKVFHKIFTAALDGAATTSKVDMVQTAVAAPVDVSTVNTAIAGATSKRTGRDLYSAVLASLTVRTGNWSSVLKFDYLDTDDYNANKYRNEIRKKHSGAKYPSAGYKILVSTGEDRHEYLSADNPAHADLFGYKGHESEFTLGFFPWISRVGGVSLTADQDIEKNVAASIKKEDRIVGHYRDRIVSTSDTSTSSGTGASGSTGSSSSDPTITSITSGSSDNKSLEGLERMMGDIINAAPISIQQTDIDLNDSKYQGKNAEKIDRANRLIMGSNDGMLYVYQRSKTPEGSDPKEMEPYELKFNFLPADMPRQEGFTLGKVLPMISETGYGKEYESASNTSDSTNDPNNTNVDVTYSGWPHIYGIDGGLSYVTTAPVAGRQQETIMMANMGQGARGTFALKVGGFDGTRTDGQIPVGMDAPEDNWEHTVPLWSLKNGEKAKVGYTVSEPIFGQLATRWATDALKANQAEDNTATPLFDESAPATPYIDKDVYLAAFISNGYPTGENDASHDAKPTLYIVNALGQDIGTAQTHGTSDEPLSAARTLGEAGEILAAISAEDSDSNALAAPAVIDTNGDGTVDVVYAGDFAGDLWRFDLRYDGKKWKAVKIFDGSPEHPITTSPSAYYITGEKGLKYVITFGTGSELYPGDIKDAKAAAQQRIYGIYDDLSEVNPKALTTDNLLQRKFNEDKTLSKGLFKEGFNAGLTPALRTVDQIKECDVSGSKTLALDANEECIAKYGKKKGWYVDLLNMREITTDINGSTNIVTSERVTVKPEILLNTAIYTTRSFIMQDSTSAEDLLNSISGTAGSTGSGSGSGSTSGTIGSGSGTGSTGTNPAPISTGDSESCNGSDSVVVKTTALGTSWLLGINVLTGGVLDQAKFGFMIERDAAGRSLHVVKSGLEPVVGLELDSASMDDDSDTGGSSNDYNKNVASKPGIMGDALESETPVAVLSNDNGQMNTTGLAELDGGVATYDSHGNLAKNGTGNLKERDNSCKNHNNFGIDVALSGDDVGALGMDVAQCSGGSFIRTSIREIKHLDK